MFSRGLFAALWLVFWFAVSGASGAWAQDTGGRGVPAPIAIGNLVDFSGRTALVGRAYGQGKIDALEYINAQGGIAGRPLRILTYDYGYILPRAIRRYLTWVQKEQVVAIQGYGTTETEILAPFITRDGIPNFSGSYSASLTDPTGAGLNTAMPTPYNFFVGPSYSDGVRGLLDWAWDDWQRQNRAGRPKFVHMGADHPFPNSALGPGINYALRKGFRVHPPIRYALNPRDFAAPCAMLKKSAADYAYLGNTSRANIALLQSCHRLGVDVQFMANIWGFDENVMAAAGLAADRVVWVMGAVKWGGNEAGMALVRKISRMSDPEGTQYRTVHYIRGVCSVYYMKEALEQARDMPGGITGPNIKAAMYRRADWVPEGLEGVCPPATWTPTDHRGVNRVFIYQGFTRGGRTDMRQVHTSIIPRKPEWLGW